MNLFEQHQNDPDKPADAVSHRRGNDTSAAGAEDAMADGRAVGQMARYLAMLDAAGRLGLTDHEAAERMSLPVGTICARRGSRRGKACVVDSGRRRRGPTGVKNKVWIHRKHMELRDATA